MAECCPPVLSSSGGWFPALCLPQRCCSGSGRLIQHWLELGIRKGQCWSPPHIHRVQIWCPRPLTLSLLMSWPWEMKGWDTANFQEPPQLRDHEHLPPKVMFTGGVLAARRWGCQLPHEATKGTARPPTTHVGKRHCHHGDLMTDPRF